MKTLRKILKWFALDMPEPNFTEKEVRNKMIEKYGLKDFETNPCWKYGQQQMNRTYSEYNQMEINLRHAKEWRESGNCQMELRSLSQLWRILLDRQNEIRNMNKEEQPAVIIPGSTGPNTTAQ